MDKNEEKLFIEALYDEYSLSLKSMMSGILKNGQKSEKALLRTFLKIVKYRYLFYDDNVDASRLIVLFARGSCFNCIRKEKHLDYSEKNLFPNGIPSVKNKRCDSVLAELLKKSNLKWLKETVFSFGSPFKEIAVMKFYYAMETSAVADILGLKQDEVNNILCKWLVKLKVETEYKLQQNIDTAELGVAVGLVGGELSEDYRKKLDTYSVSDVSISPKIKKTVLNSLFIRQNKRLLLLAMVLLLCLIVAIFVIVIF